MSTSRALPILLPAVPGQRWSCHSCTRCCRELVVHLTRDDRDRIDQQKWGDELGASAYLQVGRSWVLNKRDDGACVFLNEQTKLCRIHARFGEPAKPTACRVYPFSLREMEDGWRASWRFDCPSVAASEGVEMARHRAWLRDVSGGIDRSPAAGDDCPELTGGVRATDAETQSLIDRFVRWFQDRGVGLTSRLTGAADVTTMLGQARFNEVRGERLGELADVLFEAARSDATEDRPLAPPTARQEAMLRQLVFAHVEHVALADLTAGLARRWGRRWRQFRAAGRYRRGRGAAPTFSGFVRAVDLGAVPRVAPAFESDDVEAVDNLLRRFVQARLESRMVFGNGYYGWPMFTGLPAFWASIAAAGWLGRLFAAADGRPALAHRDVVEAIGIVDRAAARSPALGSSAEKLRIAYLARESGVARLLGRFALVPT